MDFTVFVNNVEIRKGGKKCQIPQMKKSIVKNAAGC